LDLLLLSLALECHLEAPPVQMAGGPVLVRFRLRNPGRQPLSVLDWHTPLEGLLADIFSIRTAAGGQPLRYTGPLVKRGDPEADEYVEIAPGGEASEEVDLAAAYDLSRPGRYTVSFKGPLRDVTSPASVPRPRDDHVGLPVTCNTLEIEIVDGSR
jgi:hypothetical protein